MVTDWVCALSFFSCLKIWSWKPYCGGWSQCHQSASCFCKATDANLGKSQSYKPLLQTKCHRKNSLCRGWWELSEKLLWTTLLPDILLCRFSRDWLSMWAGGAQGCPCLPDDPRHTSSDTRPEQIRPANGTVIPARIKTELSQTQRPSLGRRIRQPLQLLDLSVLGSSPASPTPPMPCPEGSQITPCPFHPGLIFST